MMASATQRVKVTKALEDYSEELVQMADETLSDSVMEDLLRAGQFMNQLNNLANMAREATGPAVVENWVRYQMGRRETQKSWSDSGFGEKVLGNLEAIHEKVGLLDLEGKSQQRQAEMIMIRRYTGYLIRWFVARGGQK